MAFSLPVTISNLCNRALELGVGTMARFCLNDISTLGDKSLVQEEQQQSVVLLTCLSCCGTIVSRAGARSPVPQSSQHAVPKAHLSLHKWRQGGKRKLRLSNIFAVGLSLSNRY